MLPVPLWAGMCRALDLLLSFQLLCSWQLHVGILQVHSADLQAQGCTRLRDPARQHAPSLHFCNLISDRTAVCRNC